MSQIAIASYQKNKQEKKRAYPIDKSKPCTPHNYIVHVFSRASGMENITTMVYKRLAGFS